MENKELKSVTRCVDINSGEFDFLKELYKIMNKYNMHRIYRVSYTNGKIIDASQVLKSSIGKTELTDSIFDFINDHLPFIYFNIFYRFHIYKYRKNLKKLFKKYDIVTIASLSFSLEQGIYITDNKLCICGVDILNKFGRVFHIDRLYLDIK